MFLGAKKQNINCNFEDPYLCGYTTTLLGSASWVRSTGGVSSVAPGPDVDGDNSTSGMSVQPLSL